MYVCVGPEEQIDGECPGVEEEDGGARERVHYIQCFLCHLSDQSGQQL